MVAGISFCIDGLFVLNTKTFSFCANAVPDSTTAANSIIFSIIFIFFFNIKSVIVDNTNV